MKINKPDFAALLKDELNEIVREHRRETKAKRKDLRDVEIVQMYPLYTKPEVMDMITAFESAVLKQMGDGNTVSFQGFGSFDLTKLPERWCPDPQTGEKCIIESHWVPRFYPGTRMKVVVKKWNDNQKRGIK